MGAAGCRVRRLGSCSGRVAVLGAGGPCQRRWGTSHDGPAQPDPGTRQRPIGRGDDIATVGGGAPGVSLAGERPAAGWTCDCARGVVRCAPVAHRRRGSWPRRDPRRGREPHCRLVYEPLSHPARARRQRSSIAHSTGEGRPAARARTRRWLRHPPLPRGRGIVRGSRVPSGDRVQLSRRLRRRLDASRFRRHRRDDGRRRRFSLAARSRRGHRRHRLRRMPGRPDGVHDGAISARTDAWPGRRLCIELAANRGPLRDEGRGADAVRPDVCRPGSRSPSMRC